VKRSLIFPALSLAFVVLMSLPWLVPHMGWTALIGLLPLLIMEQLAAEESRKHFWWWHYGTFVLWNAVTTWWVGEATVGGAVFAILANSLQMSLIFGTFRWVKRRLGGALPYIFLAAAWLAWEKYYLTVAEISWPWLVLGNAFADTTSLIQWYSVLGHLGGSLWVWLSNLSLFGLMVALSDGRMARWNGKARLAAFAGTLVALFGPMVWSWCLSYDAASGQELKVVIGQPNYDPYEKFQSLSREEQDKRFLDLLEQADWSSGEPTLVLAPETFTARVYTNAVGMHETSVRFQEFLHRHPQATLIFGASTYEPVSSYSQPDPCAYEMGKEPNGKTLWMLLHNSAILTDTSARYQLFHKSKLVVGTELTPYPKFFIPLEKLLNHGDYLMAKDIGQKDISCLSMSIPATEESASAKNYADARPATEESASAKNYADATADSSVSGVAIGTAVCYESVYGEYCTGYVRKGAQLLTVITNDAWWGNTPGYKQHFSYSRLRAIETRRWVARCGNTGVSAIIDPCGRVLERTPWWEPALLEGTVKLSTYQTFFVRNGDIVGRISVFLFGLLLLAALFRPSKKRR
jgi:apolipoprotein N-acyltransferase